MNLRTDYLIVGSGAVGMAFADTLLTDTDADIVVVDRHQLPGGHWNDAYPFVTLHQPSAFYGVNSHELSSGRTDETGLNEGLGELATGAEITAYFDQVMRHRLLPSGRVRYFPMSQYHGNTTFSSILTGATISVSVRRKIVDTTHLRISVPSTHTPSFAVSDRVQCLPINALASITQPPDDFVVIGAGKTGIDACLWLLDKGVEPDRIRWIMPRDAWLQDRRHVQNMPSFFFDTFGAQAAQLEALSSAASMNDLFVRLEQAGVLLRIDPSVRPKMFHAATVSQAELTQLRRISNIVRLGRVRSIQTDRIALEHGEIATSPATLHVNCTARGLSRSDGRPIFEDGLITPLPVRLYQPVFSAALIAHIEATRDNDVEKNSLCQPVPIPDDDTDFVRMMTPHLLNQNKWSWDSDLRAWLFNHRLAGISRLAGDVGEDPEKLALLKRLREASQPALDNLGRLLSEIDTPAAR